MEKTAQHTNLVHDFFDRRTASYDGFYEPASAIQRWTNRLFRKAVYLRRDEVLTLAHRFDAQTVLDVGSGSGRNSVWWARNGIQRVHGVELSEQMVEEARTVAEQAAVGDACSFERADIMQWQTDDKYDIVAACGVFDYVIDAQRLLGHMARFSNKVIYGSFPCWSLVRSPLRKLRYALRGCPTHFYRRKDVAQVFEDVGFGPYEIKAVPAGYLAWSYKA